MIRAILRFAVEKAIINHIFFLFILLLAFFAYRDIPKEIFPPAALDRVSITGTYLGASADVLDKMVVEGIEEELKKIPSIESIESVIQSGNFWIKSEIKPGEEKLLVLSDVKDALSKVKRDLPADMNEPIARIEVHQYPLLLIAVSGSEDKARLIKAARELKKRLSSLADIGEIDIRGEADEEVRITIDQTVLRTYGISEQALLNALRNLTSIYPVGKIDAPHQHLYLSAINGEEGVKRLAQTIIKVGNKRFRLGDVARIEARLGDSDQLSHFNGKENISLSVNKTKEGNAIALSRQTKQILQEEFAKAYPDLEFTIYTDTSVWIRNRLNLVTANIFFGLLLVFSALMLSVDARIAVVVAIGIPTSFMIALISADVIGYSLNMLTLLGGLIALGMLVDEAIVVAENIYRHMEMGKSPKEAAIEGSAEMFPAVLTATMTTVFAFLPLLIMSGKMGMFMQVLPVMITVLLLSSLFEAFYFLPLHAKEVFSLGGALRKQRSPFWQKTSKVYQKALLGLLRYKKIALSVIVAGIVAVTWVLLSLTKFQLFPEFDTQQIYLTGEVDVQNNLKETEAYVTRLEEAILEIIDTNETDSVTSVIGIRFNPDLSFELGEHLFHIFINLHEKQPSNFFERYINPIFAFEYDDSDMIRERKAKEIARQIEQEVLARFEKIKEGGKSLYREMTIYVPQTGIVGHDIEIGIGGKEDRKILEAIGQIKQALARIEGVEDIYDNADEGQREIKLKINDYGQRLGFSEGYLVSTLQGMFLASEYAKMLDTQGLVRIKVESRARKEGVRLSDMLVSLPDGTGTVALGEIVEFVPKRTFLRIYKEDGVKIFSAYAKVDKEKVTPQEVMDRISPVLHTLKEQGFHVVIKGEQSKNAQVRKEMTQAALMAMFLIFLALVWMFDALLLPLIVLSTIPLSILGALAGTRLMDLHLTLPGIMGLIGLAGVVVNDGLIMLDFIRKAKSHTELAERAILRLRPILLTSITTVLGLSTLMFFASGQALILQPMAVSLGFGIAWATLLNLFYVPLLFAVLYRVDSQK